ncbi:MAG: pyridoxamine 5'-phosphate oxidase family protein [Polyangiaceae bacterium]
MDTLRTGADGVGAERPQDRPGDPSANAVRWGLALCVVVPHLMGMTQGNATADAKQHANDKPDQERSAPGSIQEMRKLLATFDTVMLVTLTTEGDMRGRAMAVQDNGALHDCDLWFVTSDESPKIAEIESDARCCVTAYRASDGANLSISANVRKSRDLGEIRRLWKEDWKGWFQKGPEDPTIVLLKLTASRAEYWEQRGGRLRILYELAKAYVTGERADAGLDPVKRI